jgi:nitrite reductase/ring-hydroxylating ferredoxin subunit
VNTTAQVQRLENAEALDRAAAPIREVVHRAVRGRAKDWLHGVWLGHPLHPMLAQAAVGAFSGAAVLDTARGGRFEPAVRRMIVTGLAASLPSAASGAVDWADAGEQQQRDGVVHAAANVTGLVCYTGSLVARLTGRQGLGRCLGFLGFAAVGGAGWLGGHLAYRQATGANHAEAVPHLIEPGWHEIGAVEEFGDGKLSRRMIGVTPVAVHRQGADWHVLADACPHLAGPLSEGEVADGCVTCPWHGSTFRLTDGSVVHGPATAPAPSFRTRVRDGRLEVSLGA